MTQITLRDGQVGTIISEEEAKNWEAQQRAKEDEPGNFKLGARIFNNDSPASSRLGVIYRNEWNNWIDQFLPVDRKLMELAGGKTDNRAAEESAKYATKYAFGRAREADQMSRRGLGTSLSADESAYLNRNSSLAEAAATAKNINQTRLHAADRDKEIMSGGLTGGLRNITEQTG